MYNEIVALRNDPLNIDGWNRITVLINQIEFTVIDGFHAGQYQLGPDQEKYWRKLEDLVLPIRTNLIMVGELTEAGNLDQRVNARFGLLAAELLKNLSAFYFALQSFGRTFL